MCRIYLKELFSDNDFKILETMKSSGVFKLVPKGSIKTMVNYFRPIMYNKNRLKMVPSVILNGSYSERLNFFFGYYFADGAKCRNEKTKHIRFCNKGKIGSLGLYYIMKSLGYNCSIRTRKDKVTMFSIAATTNNLRKETNVVKKIELLSENNNDFVYDLETEQGLFNVGVGEITVKNTDSNYIQFPHLKTAQENWDYAEYVAKKVTALFPPPIELEFEEEIYWRFAILTKKRYMYKKCKRDGKVGEKIGNKGVLLSRRDNSPLVRNIYENIMMKIFNKISMHDVYYYIIGEINKLCMGVLPPKTFVITKKVGNHEKKTRIRNEEVSVYLECASCEKIIRCENNFYNNQCKCKIREKGIMGEYRVPLLSLNDEEKRKKQFKLKKCSTEDEYYTRCLPAQVQLAERMRKKRGQRVDQGSRIEYVITLHNSHKGKQYEKIEHIDYFKKHKDVLKIDYLYYLDMIATPIDQLLNIMYCNNKGFIKNFVQMQYRFRWKYRQACLDTIKAQNKPIFKIIK